MPMDHKRLCVHTHSHHGLVENFEWMTSKRSSCGRTIYRCRRCSVEIASGDYDSGEEPWSFGSALWSMRPTGPGRCNMEPVFRLKRARTLVALGLLCIYMGGGVRIQGAQGCPFAEEYTVCQGSTQNQCMSVCANYANSNCDWICYNQCGSPWAHGSSAYCTERSPGNWIGEGIICECEY